MSAISDATVQGVKTFSAQVTGTLQEVTDNPNVLIYGFVLLNTTVADAYLQVFDADLDNVTLGSTSPTFVIPNDRTAHNQHVFPAKPIFLTSGFTIASTTARANSTGAIQEVLIFYADTE